MNKDWERVTKCPICGGKLELSEFYTYSLDFKITKKGVLSKRPTKSEAGPIDCMNAYCANCQNNWDATEVCVEADGSVWLKERRRKTVFTV